MVAVVGDFDSALCHDGVDEAPRGGEPVVVPQLCSGVVDSVFGKAVGVPFDQLVLAPAPGIGSKALAQEIAHIVGAPASDW